MLGSSVSTWIGNHASSRHDLLQHLFRLLVVTEAMLLPLVLRPAPTLCQAAEPATRPNIIFIMADDLGYGHLGCHGQQKIRTPNIDRLAAEGMRFTDCYAGAPVCAPSRSVLMTGKHGGHTSVRANSGGVPLLAKDVTIAEVLKPAGYTTAIFGKWGLGDAGTAGVPNQQGFDHFFGYLHQVHCHFYYPYFLWKDDQKYLLPGNEGGKRQQYTHDEIVDQAKGFLRHHKQQRFFLYLPFTIPHTELLVPEDSLKQYGGKFLEPNPYVGKHYASQSAPRAAFAAMVTRMDRHVGEIMELIMDLEIDNETIVFFTSDNGGQDGGGPDLSFFNGNGPLRGAKGQVYEGGIRVPMIARWPSHVPAGSVSRHVWAFDDVLPTLAELAGAANVEGVDGVSAVPTLVGEQAAGHRQQHRKFFYWEIGSGKNLRQAARMGNWKAVRMGTDRPMQLFDLATDIQERKDVAATHPNLVAEIETYLQTAHTPPRPYPQEPPTWGYPRQQTGYLR